MFSEGRSWGGDGGSILEWLGQLHRKREFELFFKECVEIGKES